MNYFNTLILQLSHLGVVEHHGGMGVGAKGVLDGESQLFIPQLIRDGGHPDVRGGSVEGVVGAPGIRELLVGEALGVEAVPLLLRQLLVSPRPHPRLPRPDKAGNERP